jgi:radical SAM protein with 4Fe4S-binding SPASM domain
VVLGSLSPAALAWLHRGAVFGHVAAVVVWFGAVAYYLLILRPALRRSGVERKAQYAILAEIRARLKRVVGVAVLVLLATGLTLARLRGFIGGDLPVDPHRARLFHLKLLEEDPARAADVLALLRWNGGGLHSSGVGIADIDFLGNVHPDQFWMQHNLGNVKERPFSEIWQDLSDPILAGLRDRAPLLKGRCGACRWKDVCGGSFRVRALQVHGDPWAEDPGCYLTDEECGITDRAEPTAASTPLAGG